MVSDEKSRSSCRWTIETKILPLTRDKVASPYQAAEADSAHRRQSEFFAKQLVISVCLKVNLSKQSQEVLKSELIAKQLVIRILSQSELVQTVLRGVER